MLEFRVPRGAIPRLAPSSSMSLIPESKPYSQHWRSPTENASHPDIRNQCRFPISPFPRGKAHPFNAQPYQTYSHRLRGPEQTESSRSYPAVKSNGGRCSRSVQSTPPLSTKHPRVFLFPSAHNDYGNRRPGYGRSSQGGAAWACSFRPATFSNGEHARSSTL